MNQAVEHSKNERRYLRRSEAAAYLNCSLRQLDEWKANGEIKFIQLGRRLVIFRMEDLDAFMDRHLVDVGPQR